MTTTEFDSRWQPIETAPKDGTKFDAWAVFPTCPEIGVRFADVFMRGDGSGFGIIRETTPPSWEYLESADGVYPMWKLTHWMPLPSPPGD